MGARRLHRWLVTGAVLVAFPCSSTVSAFAGAADSAPTPRMPVESSAPLAAAGESAYREAVPARGSEPPRLLVFNHGFDFPIPFEREFDFDQLPFAGEYTDVTLDGIRVQAPGRPWQHLDGSPLGGRAARQRDSSEFWRIDLPADSYAFEFKLWESTQPGVGPDKCFNFDFCTDTLYRIRVLSGNLLLREFDFSPYNEFVNTTALWSSVPITRIELDAVINDVDDEFFGDMRAGSTPLPAGLDLIASRQTTDFGLHAAIRDGRALISDSAGFEFWRRSGNEPWTYSNRLNFDNSIERLALGVDHAVLAVSTPAGNRLRIFEIQGDDPAFWPMTEIAYTGSAAAIEIEDDLIAVGVGDQVLLYLQDPFDGWVFQYGLQPAAPIANATQFGRSIGMDSGLLAVSAGRGLFHVYQRGAGAQFSEIFRQEMVLTAVSLLDLSDSTVIVQTREGGLRIYQPDASGVWSPTQFPVVGLPSEIGLALGEGIRIDGDTFIAMQGFRTPPNDSFRRIVSVWKRGGTGEFSRSALFVEPHQLPIGATMLGSNGRAFALDGDDLLLGYPFTPWCDHELGSNAFFGDSGTQNYRNVCGARAGAAYFARASLLNEIIFESGFEP